MASSTHTTPLYSWASALWKSGVSFRMGKQARITRKSLLTGTLITVSLCLLSCDNLTEQCRETCSEEHEQCLGTCAEWSPEDRYICTDSCVFAYVDCMADCTPPGEVYRE